MLVESSVASVSWIPSELVIGPIRAAFAAGVARYDDPPPEVVDNLADLHAAHCFRFANHLAAWIDVADGRIVDAGYSGRGYICGTRAGRGPQREATIQSAQFPDTRTPPEINATEP